MEVKGLPCTDVTRTLTDVAGELTEEQLTPLVDTALARRWTTVAAIEEEIGRRTAQGRVGPARLAGLMRRPGLVGGPPPPAGASRAT